MPDDAAARSTPTLAVRCAMLAAALAARAADRWRGAGVEYRRRADGAVAAVVLGVTGVGETEADALRDLERRLGVWAPRRPG